LGCKINRDRLCVVQDDVQQPSADDCAQAVGTDRIPCAGIDSYL